MARTRLQKIAQVLIILIVTHVGILGTTRANNLEFRKTSFLFPGDGRPNYNRSIGPFCCKGETATVLTTAGRPVGYIYFFDWKGRALGSPFLIPTLSILVSGIADPAKPAPLWEKVAVDFLPTESSVGASHSVEVGNLLFKVTMEKAKIQDIAGLKYFDVQSLVVRVDVSSSQIPSHRLNIQELPGGAPISNDLAVPGGRFQSTVLPSTAPAPSDDGAPEINKHVLWKQQEFDLPSSESREVEVVVPQSSLVVARVIAFGSAEPIELSVMKDRILVGTADALALPPDRSEATVSVRVGSGGYSSVRLVNRGRVTRQIRLIIGVLPDAPVQR